MKCLIIGKFAYKDNIMDGQTVKCRTIYDAVSNKYKKENISYIDTYKWQKKPFKLFYNIIYQFKKSDNIIMMPAQKGVKVFAPILSLLNKKYNKKIYYIVIGSWLYEEIKYDKKIIDQLKSFNNIFVETNLLKKNLLKIGFTNVKILNNYKNIQILSENSFPKCKEKKIINICSFSRVNEMKGIKDAILSLKEINKDSILVKYDIYGPIEEEFKKEFANLVSNNSTFVSYLGIIDSNKSVQFIKKYDALIFPTKYKTEGIPGTIIDSYAAGVPVIASKWENYSDIIENNVTGLIFKFNDFIDFKEKIVYLYNHQREIYKMKKNCLNKADEYCQIKALKELFEVLEGKNEKDTFKTV